MSDKTAAEVAGAIVALLNPLVSEDRLRIVRAALVLLGEEQPAPVLANKDAFSGGGPAEATGSEFPSRAQIWLKQNGISAEDVEQVFHISGTEVTVIAAELPGKTVGEKATNAYLLTGLQKLLSSGSVDFDDKSARVLCESTGCYDATNHSKYLAKNKANHLSGSKDKGWELTGPGLKRVATLVKEMAASVHK